VFSEKSEHISILRACRSANSTLFAEPTVETDRRDKAPEHPLEPTIIMTEPNELTTAVHNRMPVILAPRDYDRWMAPVDPARLPVDLLRPFDAEQVTAWKVGAAVGNVRNHTPELCVPP